VFIGLGLSGVIPAMHYVITDGFWAAVDYAALGWLVLMAVLYILGALIYACRVPERIWPGRFDIWVGVSFLNGLLFNNDWSLPSLTRLPSFNNFIPGNKYKHVIFQECMDF